MRPDAQPESEGFKSACLPTSMTCGARAILFALAVSSLLILCLSEGKAYYVSNLDKIAICLNNGKEAVMFASRPPECHPYMRGKDVLDEQGIEQPHETDLKTICAQKRSDPSSDRRVLPINLIKALAPRLKDSIDPVGFRIIGGLYCDGIDLRGMKIDQSIILDRSVFGYTVDLRNFRTAGDFSIDSSMLYHNFYVIRADIGGSVYAQFMSVRSITIADSTIQGALKLGYTFANHKLVVESNNINGDIDASHAYFSYAAIVKNNISGMLDFGQSQARCSYDIRSNEIGGVIVTNFGFGIYSANPGPIYAPTYTFDSIKDENVLSEMRVDPLAIYTSDLSKARPIIQSMKQCDPINSIAPGSFIFVDNRIKNSLCLRAPRWLKSSNTIIAHSNLYINENIVNGAIWIDFEERFRNKSDKIERIDGVKNHTLRMFNVSTGTLIVNFDFDDALADLKINGLGFKRIYNSSARCEASVSLRATKPVPDAVSEEMAKTTFPPDLKLPSPRQVLSWIEQNSFKATQPFAEFVGAFQQAGDLDGARELKANAAWLALTSAASKLTCLSCPKSESETESPRSSDGEGSVEGDRLSNFAKLKNWVENLVVVLFRGILWLLADHGYGPERIGWVVLATLIVSLVFFHAWLKVVGFSASNQISKVDPNTWLPITKIHPIGFIFLFDHLLPAYKIRNQDYNVSDYFMRSRDAGGQLFQYLGIRYHVEKATPGKTRKVERFLNVIRFLGLVYLVFVLAALGKIVQ